MAGVESIPTGFCTLDRMEAQTCLLYTDYEIVEMLNAKLGVVAVDARWLYLKEVAGREERHSL